MRVRASAVIPFLVAFLVLTQGCAPGIRLLTSPATAPEVTGTYDLLTYGCRYPNDIKNLAILISEGARYPVEVYDLPTSYYVEKGLAAATALDKAGSFLRGCGTRRVTGTRLSRISDGSGGTLGYEVRTLYFPLEFGITDVLLVNYALTDGKVRVYVKIDPDVERAIESVGGNDRDSAR